jgi:hypothetical protein
MRVMPIPEYATRRTIGICGISGKIVDCQSSKGRGKLNIPHPNTEFSMTDNNTAQKPKEWLDILAAISLAAFLLCPWWMYLDDIHSPPPHNGTIAPLIGMVVSLYPAMAGMVRLIWRYSKVWKSKYTLIALLVIVGFIAVPMFLMKNLVLTQQHLGGVVK